MKTARRRNAVGDLGSMPEGRSRRALLQPRGEGAPLGPGENPRGLRSMVAPSRQTVAPRRQMVAPSRQMVDPSRHVVAPYRQMVAPSRQMAAPSR